MHQQTGYLSKESQEISQSLSVQYARDRKAVQAAGGGYLHPDLLPPRPRKEASFGENSLAAALPEDVDIFSA